MGHTRENALGMVCTLPTEHNLANIQESKAFLPPLSLFGAQQLFIHQGNVGLRPAISRTTAQNRYIIGLKNSKNLQ